MYPLRNPPRNNKDCDNATRFSLSQINPNYSVIDLEELELK